MTEAEMVQAMDGKQKVRYGGRVGYIVDSYKSNTGEIVAIVSQKAASIAAGNNVLLSTLTLVKE